MKRVYEVYPDYEIDAIEIPKQVSFAEWVSLRRQALFISKKDLVDRLGLYKEIARKWERGETLPRTMKEIHAVESVLGKIPEETRKLLVEITPEHRAMTALNLGGHTFHEWLKLSIAANGSSRKELAETLSVSRDTISNWLSNVLPNEFFLEKIEACFGPIPDAVRATMLDKRTQNQGRPRKSEVTDSLSSSIHI